MSESATALEPYIGHLSGLPFIDDVRVVELAPVSHGGKRTDAAVEVHTPDGWVSFLLEVKNTHLSYAVAERAIEFGASLGADWILAAPHVGGPIGRFLIERGVNYIDRVGNCHLKIGDRFLALKEGSPPETRTPHHKGIRAPGYQVLFALLAEPEFVSSPIRAIASEAGTSRQAVSDMRRRLVADGLMLHGRKKYVWAEQHKRRALDRWLNGYLDVVRPRLLVGRYRTPDKIPVDLEARIEDMLDLEQEAWFGGSAACHRLTGYYRGPLTVLHIDGTERDVRKKLRAVDDSNGPLVLARLPGRTAKRGAAPATVHPLLVYSEMLAEGTERATEAAARLLERFTEFGQ